MYVKTQSKIVPILYFCIGAVALVLGIVCLIMKVDYPSFTYSIAKYYNGDAYTGIQNTCVDISQNITDLGDIMYDSVKLLSTCFGFVLIVVALVFVTLGVKALTSTMYVEIKKQKTE